MITPPLVLERRPGGPSEVDDWAEWASALRLPATCRAFVSFVRPAGPTGLLPEEYDPVAEQSLGDHPRAYSHVGLIRCARLLD